MMRSHGRSDGCRKYAEKVLSSSIAHNLFNIIYIMRINIHYLTPKNNVTITPIFIKK